MPSPSQSTGSPRLFQTRAIRPHFPTPPSGHERPSNFVEGFRKRTTPDKLRFYNIAQASADECLYQLILAHDLRYADTTDLQSDLEEVSRMLQGYINGLDRAG